ncbi:HIT family protein [Candidatus Vallotia lariciata]|uniref:HIT family protein n=1 Tax=Candidatus Vallotia laricis TaxID=2018052 RepID=UPI001D0110AA|nr:HIT domain-containing protein [Candidatus Vallotia lariciata]UDG82660.1 HIT family protein [Candidatus Vallotia lariciata]
MLHTSQLDMKDTVRYDENNIFARILRSELTCIKVSETKDVLAFMDLMPKADGHVLVVPKEAAAKIFDLSDAAGVACFRMVHRISIAIQAVFKPDGILVAQFNGVAAGQTIPHVHFHVIPRGTNKKLRLRERVIAKPEKLEEIAQLIRVQLSKSVNL